MRLNPFARNDDGALSFRQVPDRRRMGDRRREFRGGRRAAECVSVSAVPNRHPAGPSSTERRQDFFEFDLARDRIGG